MSKKKEADPTLVEETEVAPKKGKKKLILAAAGALVLLLTAVASFVLGMGLPTSAAYLLLAVLVAPALTQLREPDKRPG